MKITQIQMEHEVFANCYLVFDEETGEAAIVDPGWYEKSIPEVLSENANIKLKYILLTHGHFDHILGVDGLKKATGAKVVIHENDREHLLDPKKSLADGNFPMPQIPVDADITVSDGDVLTLGKNEIKVMHTPGHTRGGVCYITEGDDRVIFTGDTLFCMTAGRTDFFDGSEADLNNSLKKLVALDGDYRILPGHSKDTTLERERKRNWYFRRMER